MDASTTGAKESTSKPETPPALGSPAPRAQRSPSKLERGSGARKARVLQALFMQGALVIMLVTFAIVMRQDRGDMLFFVALLLIPLGWGYVFWSAHQREEKARREGVWTKEWDAVLRKRTFSALGGFVAAAILLAALATMLL